MTLDSFLFALERDLALDTGTLAPDTALSGLRQWDSMAVLLVISTGESDFRCTVSGPEIRACTTPRALYELLSSTDKS